MFGLGAATVQVAHSTYTDASSGITIQPPAFDAGNQPHLVAHFFDTPRGVFAANLNVVIQLVMGMDEYQKLTEAQFEQLGFTIDVFEKRELVGHEALWYEYHGKMQGNDLAFVSAALFLPNKIVLVTGTCLSHDIDHYRPLFTDSINSLGVMY